MRCALASMVALATLLPASGSLAIMAQADDSTFAGAPELIPPSVAGVLNESNEYDRYSIAVSGDQMLTVTLSGPVGQDFDLTLYSPQVATAPASEFHVVLKSEAEGTSAESISYLVPPGAAGPYFIEVKAFAGAAGAYTLNCSVTSENAVRLSGPDRYRTSYAASRSSFATASVAVVASGANFPDALSAAGLAGAVEGPVLLAPFTTNGEDPRVTDLCREIQRLGCTKVYVIGGEKAITAEVFTKLASAGSVAEDPKRIAGLTRYETAAKVAKEIQLLNGVPTAAFVVRGDDYPDALAVSPYAYANALPILLTTPGALDTFTSSYIEESGITDIVVAGGVSAVDDEVRISIEALNDGTATVQRMSGASRYATAADVAGKCAARGWGAWGRIGIATGTNFPDALSGGFACGARNGVLLLTSGTALSPDAYDAIEMNAVGDSTALVLGGESALSEAVRLEIAGLLP